MFDLDGWYVEDVNAEIAIRTEAFVSKRYIRKPGVLGSVEKQNK
jgi:hypothetical protein